MKTAKIQKSLPFYEDFVPNDIKQIKLIFYSLTMYMIFFIEQHKN